MVMPMLYFFMWVATKKDKGELHYEKVHENGYGRNFIFGNGFGQELLHRKLPQLKLK